MAESTCVCTPAQQSESPKCRAFSHSQFKRQVSSSLSNAESLSNFFLLFVDFIWQQCVRLSNLNRPSGCNFFWKSSSKLFAPPIFFFLEQTPPIVHPESPRQEPTVYIYGSVRSKPKIIFFSWCVCTPAQ